MRSLSLVHLTQSYVGAHADRYVVTYINSVRKYLILEVIQKLSNVRLRGFHIQLQDISFWIADKLC